MKQIIIIAAYVLCSVTGLVCFKSGSSEALTLEVTNSFLSFKISWLSVFGLVLYIISFLIYMGLISKNDLSYVVPVATGAVYLLTLLSAIVIFRERLQLLEIVGSTLILAGVVLMNIKTK